MASSTNNLFSRHVHAVQRYVSLTNPRYAPLYRSGVETHPICCFGEPVGARIVTVGLNPSVREFAPARQWPAEMTHSELADRCQGYFGNPHPWFGPWSQGLETLGAVYGDGSAVHIDLSPRATRPVSDLKEAWEQELFLEMVERDLWMFFGTLELCAEVRLLMIAGTVTGRYYINEFLQRHAPDYGCNLDGKFDRLKHPGRGKTAWHVLSRSRGKVPVFFCSSSPSDNDTALLPKRIRESSNQLREMANTDARRQNEPAARLLTKAIP